jgi:thiamine-phosphate pyrophosphorylase
VGAGEPVHVVVNRRTDLALALGSAADLPSDDRIDGVHLGFDGVSPAEARELLGEGAWIGASCHAASEAFAAREAGASYVQLAPVFPPISKPACGPWLGLSGVTVASGCGLPVLAQGGIDPENAGQVLGAGAAGVAVTGAVFMAADPGAAAGALRRALDGVRAAR